MVTRMLIVLVLWLIWGLAQAKDEEPMFTVSGYGTLAATHSDNALADFQANYFQPVGPGYSRTTDLGTDSKLALQLDAMLTPEWTATVQALAQRNYDNTFSPELEWANVKYQPQDNVYLRIGRVVAPTFMQAEYRNLGYAQTLVRPPVDFYYRLPYYHIDGLDAAYRWDLGDASLTMQLTGGEYRQKVLGVRGGVNDLQQDAYFANLILEYQSVLYRLGYSFTNHVHVASPSISAYEQAMTVLLGAGVPGAATVNDNIEFQNMTGQNLSVGFSRDTGQWLLQGEYAWMSTRSNAAQDGRAGYLLLGRRWGEWMPFIGYSAMSCTEHFNLPRIDASGYDSDVQQAAAVVNGISYGLQLKREQQSLITGIRYDFSSHADVKLQFEHIRKPAGAIGSFTQIQPGFVNSGQDANVVTLAIDFIF